MDCKNKSLSWIHTCKEKTSFICSVAELKNTLECWYHDSEIHWIMERIPNDKRHNLKAWLLSLGWSIGFTPHEFKSKSANKDMLVLQYRGNEKASFLTKIESICAYALW